MAKRKAHDVRLKRIYEPVAPDDGRRVLVERLWPRGVSKEEAHLDAWLREIGPSAELRRWYGHDPARWEEFARRYREELAAPERAALLDDLVHRAADGPLTLLCAARDVPHSNAEVVREEVARRLGAAAS
ncbi:MAG TPA: DUF488 family protein [Thermomicrobiales bacterium]|nr:DUF488 family protein [Thermomicrobiales bacterium]